TLSVYLILNIGDNKTVCICGTAVLVGSIFFITFDASKGPVWGGISSYVTGIGMGLTSTTFIVAIQNHVSWKTRGIAIASNMFMRMIGSSLGAALLGGILNAQLNGYLQKEGEQIDQTITADSANTILDSATTSAMSQETLDILENGLSYSLQAVF